MQRRLERIRRKMAGTPRLFAAVLAFVVLSASLYSMVFAVDIVTVTDTEGDSQTLMTSGSRPAEEIIEMAGLETTTHDEVVYTEKSNAAADIVIHRAFPVQVAVDGKTLQAELVDGKVSEALELCGVTLGPDDIVQPVLTADIQEDMRINVARVTYREEANREEVEEAAVNEYVAALPTAEQEAFKFSNRGVYDVTYKKTLVDGDVSDTEIISLAGVTLPREPGSTTFEDGIPCSRIEGYDDIEMSPEGLPVNYTRVMNSAVATAYSASGGKGSSGLGLYNGTVAVNPNVIPYGTRMYITSPDGGFVYGFAIATDTGTAMMEGRVDIDLFFETNGECLRFGKRALDVYILD